MKQNFKNQSDFLGGNKRRSQVRWPLTLEVWVNQTEWNKTTKQQRSCLGRVRSGRLCSHFLQCLPSRTGGRAQTPSSFQSRGRSLREAATTAQRDLNWLEAIGLALVLLTQAKKKVSLVVSISGGGREPERRQGCFYLSCYENLSVLEIIIYHAGLRKLQCRCRARTFFDKLSALHLNAE